MKKMLISSLLLTTGMMQISALATSFLIEDQKQSSSARCIVEGYPVYVDQERVLDQLIKLVEDYADPEFKEKTQKILSVHPCIKNFLKESIESEQRKLSISDKRYELARKRFESTTVTETRKAKYDEMGDFIDSSADSQRKIASYKTVLRLIERNQ